jgi:hypothetical protein
MDNKKLCRKELACVVLVPGARGEQQGSPHFHAMWIKTCMHQMHGRSLQALGPFLPSPQWLAE